MAVANEMSRPVKRRRLLAVLLISVAVCLTGIVSYVFLFGKLFPFSPICLGFSRCESSRAIVYWEHGVEFDELPKIDDWIADVEAFHELAFPGKPKIIFFGNEQTYARRSWSKARFCAFHNGCVVVSPWAIREAKQGEISMEIYLKHELSHSLLFLHKGLLSAWRYPRWLLEGIGVYSTNQMGHFLYPTRQETYGLINAGNFLPPELFGTSGEENVSLDVKYKAAFVYAEFGCIVDHLIAKRGKPQFLQYVKRLLRDDDHDRVFEEVYRMTFAAFIAEFREAVQVSGAVDQSQTFPPRNVVEDSSPPSPAP